MLSCRRSPFIFFAFAVLLSSCGSDQKAESGEKESAFIKGTSNCSATFTQELQNINDLISKSTTESDLQKVKQASGAFRAKYGKISCQVFTADKTGNIPIWINTEQQMDSATAFAEEVLKKERTICTTAFVTELVVVTNETAIAYRSKSIKYLALARRQSLHLAQAYKDIKCALNARSPSGNLVSETVDANLVIKNLLQTINSVLPQDCPEAFLKDYMKFQKALILSVGEGRPLTRLLGMLNSIRRTYKKLICVAEIPSIHDGELSFRLISVERHMAEWEKRIRSLLVYPEGLLANVSIPDSSDLLSNSLDSDSENIPFVFERFLDAQTI
jgi:hypothetical protein